MLVEITKENIDSYINYIMEYARDYASYIQDVLRTCDATKYYDEAEVVTIQHMWDIALQSENDCNEDVVVDWMVSFVPAVTRAAYKLGFISSEDAYTIAEKSDELMRYSFSPHSYDKWLSDLEHCIRNAFEK